MEGSRGEKRSSSEDLDVTPNKLQVVEPSPANVTSPDGKKVNSPGEEFELTAEMMVNDFDDERTLDEEEAMEETGEQQDELSNLEKEKDMPMEVLLAMYGYADGEDEDDESSKSCSSEEEMDNSKNLTSEETKTGEIEGNLEGEEECEDKPEEESGEKDVDDDQGPTEKEPSLLQELYKDDPTTLASGASRHLRSGSRQHSEDEEEEEEEDCEYSPEEDEWKKTIMVGSDYQAVIPEGLSKYDDAMPYENEDKLLWCPAADDEIIVKDYLNDVQQIQTSETDGINSIPRGIHIRDDEQALYLLHQCGNNIDEALRRQAINTTSSPNSKSLWSEEECRNFETGLRQYGKDFYLIHQNRVRTRSVGELVQFYYLWKKTERHDVFANKSRLEKKKYNLHPGTTDFMEKYLDEQDAPIPTVSNCHSLLAGDPKRHARTPPPYISTEPDPLNIVEARIISSHFEEIAKHLDKEGVETLVRLAGSTGSKPSNGIISTPGDSATCSSDCSSTFQLSSEGRSNHSGFQQ